jgi:hypothetical protein
VAFADGEVDRPMKDEAPSGTEIKWFAAGPGITEAVWLERTGLGYESGDPAEMANWACDVAELWLRLLRAHPTPDLADRVTEITGIPALAEDDEPEESDDTDEDAS